jgi:GntR family transcriptional regulator
MSDTPLVTLHATSDVPAYRQIANALRQHLVTGRVRPGQRLPPVRQIAIDLGVHFNTVAQAYRMLADEGWLDLKRRRGALVLDRKRPNPPDPGRVDMLLRRLRDVAAELQTIGLTRPQIAAALRLAARRVER